MKYEPNHFGKRGFTPIKRRKINCISLRELDDIAREKNLNEIDVTQLGYEKVLGTGKISSPLTIKAKFFSENAIRKIEEAKGKAVKVD